MQFLKDGVQTVDSVVSLFLQFCIISRSEKFICESQTDIVTKEGVMYLQSHVRLTLKFLPNKRHKPIYLHGCNHG